MSKQFYLSEPGMGYAATVYGANKREALNAYRRQWYPNRDRMPKGVAIWES